VLDSRIQVGSWFHSVGAVLYVLIDYITLYQLLSLPSVHTARRY